MSASSSAEIAVESRYNSRKFILTGASLFMSNVALFAGHISGEEFVDIITAILVIYGASNVAGYFAATKGK